MATHMQNPTSCLRSAVRLTRTPLGLLLAVTIMGTSGCRAFSGSNCDVSPTTLEVESGEQREVEFRAYRHWDSDRSFQLTFDSPPGVTITPAEVTFPAGADGRVKVVIRADPDAPRGVREVRMRATNATVSACVLRLTVGKTKPAIPVPPAGEGKVGGNGVPTEQEAR